MNEENKIPLHRIRSLAIMKVSENKERKRSVLRHRNYSQNLTDVPVVRIIGTDSKEDCDAENPSECEP